ncbi:MAG: hypothetical protein GX684_06985 [Ruminococcaceae bacterium]|nr:hypothetical protein [Oscillospiraceae bacterium]
MLIVIIGFVFFRASSLDSGLSIVRAMFLGFFAEPSGTAVLATVLTPLFIFLLLIGIAFSAPSLRAAAEKKLYKNKAMLPWVERTYNAACLLLLLVCILQIAAGGFAPFIYSQF